MKISFLDDEPEIFPLQYGGKARTIINLANEFIKRPEVEKVSILSKSIFSNKDEFNINKINFVKLNDENIIERIAKEMEETDIMNIHCCSFTFPNIKGKAKKFYFLHDVLIATADKGSHLDKSLGGNFDAIIAPSEYAKSIYEKYKNIIKGKTECFVIPRHINCELFTEIDKSDIEKDDMVPKLIKYITKKYKYILFFPSRPIEEKGWQYLIKLYSSFNKVMDNYCILGPFMKTKNIPDNFIDTGWIETEKMNYYYSISDVTLNFSCLPESFSQICIESVHCGTPVVSFKSGNIPNLSKITDSIILVEKNTNSIINGIVKGISMKKDRQIMNVAKNKIETTFGTNNIIEKYINLYKNYIGGSKC